MPTSINLFKAGTTPESSPFGVCLAAAAGFCIAGVGGTQAARSVQIRAAGATGAKWNDLFQ